MATINIERISHLHEAVPRERRWVDEESPCKACALRHAAYVIGLEEEDLRHLREISSSVNFAPGQTLFEEHEAADRIFSVTCGTVRMVKLMPDGRRQISGFLFPGDFLGLAADEGYAYSAEAVTACAAFSYPVSRLHQLMLKYPELEWKLVAIARHELAEAQDQILLLGRKTARERVATFLLLLSQRAALRGKPEDSLTITMSREDMADYLGVATETISRTLTEFRGEALIGIKQAKDITLRDTVALADIAEGAA